MSRQTRLRWAIFVSGEGTNLQNVLELERHRLKKNQVALVVADRECPAIARAKKFKKPTFVIDPKSKSGNADLLQTLKKYKVDAIFLLGYMRILKANFLKAWDAPIVNLHPSVLPKFKGAHAIRDAIEAHEPTLGVTLHEVVEEVDSGRILRQIEFPRDSRWSFDEAVECVHAYERRIVSDYLLDLEEKRSIVQNKAE